jgi:hypothetical protein
MSTRPYRLWDANAKLALQWRYYSYPRNAHIAALIECRWAKVGATIEVINSETGRLLGQYHRGVNAVTFRGERNEYERPGKSGKRKAQRRETVDQETGEIIAPQRH